MIDCVELFAFCDLHASRIVWPEKGLLYVPEAGLLFFDRQGFPIPGEYDEHGYFIEPTLAWARMKEDREYSRVAWDELPDGSCLSTIWLGLDHGCGGGAPLIFETMRFSADGTPLAFPDPETGDARDQRRYQSEEEAYAMHHGIVRRIRIREGH